MTINLPTKFSEQKSFGDLGKPKTYYLFLHELFNKYHDYIQVR